METMHTANDKLSPFVFASAGLHGFLFVAVVFGPMLLPARKSIPWGNSNDPGIKVGVTSRLPGIPLPSPPVVQENAPATSSKTLNPAEVLPKVKEAPTPADVKIPTGKTTKPDKPALPKQAANATPPTENTAPSNAVPGQGGQAALPFGGTTGGSGQASFGDGAFGSRFPEYVTNMTRAIQAVWTDIIAGVPRGASPRVVVTFTIGKRGEVSGLEVAQASGSSQLDNSARRAVLTAKLPPLPREYSGSSVEVRFYFEYTR
jgi:TonB family protein